MTTGHKHKVWKGNSQGKTGVTKTSRKKTFKGIGILKTTKMAWTKNGGKEVQ